MKTPKFWLSKPVTTSEMVKWVELIQLDAFKAGMTEAADIMTNSSSDDYGSLSFCKKLILTARDAKTTV